MATPINNPNAMQPNKQMLWVSDRMLLALVLSLVLVLFVFVVVGPPVGFLVFSLAGSIPLDEFQRNLFSAYIGGVIPAFLAGLANWVLLLALHSKLGKLKLGCLSVLVSSAFASFFIGSSMIFDETLAFLFFFFLCLVATTSCVLLVNKAASNILEDLGGSRLNP